MATEKEKMLAVKQRAAGRQDLRGDRQSKNDDRKRVKAVADAEARVHELEQKLAQLETDLSNSQDGAKIQKLSHEYAATQKALENAMAFWMELAED